MRYQEAQESTESRRILETEIAAANREQDANKEQLSGIEADLRRGETYQLQLKALQDELPLHVRAVHPPIIAVCTGAGTGSDCGGTSHPRRYDS